MKKAKKILFSLFIMIYSMLSVIPVYADETPSSPSLGGIGIETNAYILDENGRRTNKTSIDMLYPGQLVGYLIEIHNTAMPAYVRTKVELSTTCPDIELKAEEILTGISSEWQYINGYFYCKAPLLTEQYMKLSNGIKIPDNNALAEGGITIKTTSEAVQSENFTPDFTSNDPWHGVSIEDAMSQGIRYVVEKSFTVSKAKSFSGDLDKEKILTTVGNMMPGDSITDTLIVTPNKKQSLILTAIYDKDFPKQADLIQLTIRDEDKVLYEDSLFSKKLKNGISLGTYNKEEDLKLTYTLTLSSNLTNISSWLELPVEFRISAKTSSSGGGGSPDDGGGDSGGSSSYVTPAAAVLGAIRDIPEQGVLGAIRTNIKTGDEAFAFVLFVTGFVAALTGITLLVCRSIKKNRRKG